MLHLDEKLLAIDDEIKQLATEILETKEAAHYRQARQDFLADLELQAGLDLLNENLEYLNFREDLRALKKQLNLHPKVYALRLAENDFQTLLSEETREIVSSVSDDIAIDENLPLKGGHHHH